MTPAFVAALKNSRLRNGWHLGASPASSAVIRGTIRHRTAIWNTAIAARATTTYTATAVHHLIQRGLLLIPEW